MPSFVILYVKDPRASAAFYEKLLGTPPAEQSPTFVMFALSPGVLLGLWIRDEVTPRVSAAPGASELAVTVGSNADVQAACARWRAEGAQISLEPTTLDFGYCFAMRDPDGHLVRVFCPPREEKRLP